MNLAGNQVKQLFKALRTGARPSTVGLWAAATAVDQLRRRSRPARELIVSKRLEPGESYVIRVPGDGESPLAASISSDTSVSTGDASGAEASITTQILSAPTELVTAANETEPVEPDLEAPTTSRRQRRRASRIASLDEAELDREVLPRRQQRRLGRAERRARTRPSRRRIRKARRRQKRAARAYAHSKHTSRPSRRKRRRRRAAERQVEYRQARVDRRSTRRRRRELRKAQKQLARI